MKIPREFKKLLDNGWREAAVYGGRFSLKSHTVARILLIRARQQKTRVLCAREMQNSIADSSHQLLKDLIIKYELNDFKVTDNSIENKVNGSDFIFKGLHRNEQSIKSIEGVDIAWVEEAQTVTENSLEILTPTIRKENSQIIYTYNRLEEEDPVHKRLVLEGRPNTLIINVNYDIAIRRNWMPSVIRDEMEDDKKFRPELYKHKWLGEPLSNAGRAFGELTPNIHIIDPFVLPPGTRYFAGYDHGYNHPFSFVLFAIVPDGTVYVRNRLTGRFKEPDEIAAEIKALCDPLQTRIEIHAGLDLWSRGRKGGPTIAEDFEANGLNYGEGYYLIKAKVDRVQGVNEIRKYIRYKNKPNEQPSLFFFRNCKGVFDVVSKMQFDEKKPEDVMKIDADDKGHGGDDDYDAFRYGLMSRAYPDTKPDQDLPDDSAQKILMDHIKKVEIGRGLAGFR